MMTPILLEYTMSPEVVAFSTTRQGGCSIGAYAALNINRYCGDDPVHIQCNREALCQLLGIADDHLVMPHQTHDTRVACIDESFLTLPTEAQQSVLEGVDAVMTSVKGVCIGVSTADCIPVLLYDHRHHAACAVHAGWRGTVGRIVEKAVTAMSTAFGTLPSDLVAQIGPGISLDSFEVGDEVYEQFKALPLTPSEDGRYFWRRFPSFSDPQQLKWHINLPEINRHQLIASGLSPERIALSDICTYQTSDRFFSARRLGVQSGRIFTGILLPTHP